MENKSDKAKKIYRFKKNNKAAVVFMTLKGRKQQFIARCDITTKIFFVTQLAVVARMRELGYEEVTDGI